MRNTLTGYGLDGKVQGSLRHLTDSFGRPNAALRASHKQSESEANDGSGE